MEAFLESKVRNLLIHLSCFAHVEYGSWESVGNFDI